ncbi:unnamed protein product [Leptidea sinapis]|uniref:Rho guanine nucleotide exchange factor 7 n=1 Tax=Leptidea sinapis TaxID=189913 RepID=A0A5E4R319_9NEOP|nr:unnamed protein product [Leptidea sinapis]
MSNDNYLVKAIYSFKGKNNDELCFKKGDIITVTQKEEGGWWEGTLGETTGWFPSNYVTEHKDPAGSLTTSPIRAASEIQAFRNVVLKDIIDSEKAHVAEMQGLISNFLQPLENSDIEDLNTWMENAGAVCPGVLVLTAGLSKPFRRLGKYPAMLQELARHVHEAHPDRGDTHRASVVYKDIASGCAALRRQKELELQVVTGEVRGWPGGELATLGDVLHMGSVAVGPSHQDRYLVLFPSALLLLSVSKRVSAFVYEGCLPLTGITVCKLDDTDKRKNAFEISGPMIDTIVAVCQTRAEADNWVSLLQKHSNNSSPAHEPSQPQSLPHLARSPSEGALSSINSSRRSLYHVTLPPPTYPAASPYYSLTKYFARLVRKKVITRQMLRKLLHERTWVKALELSGLPVKRRHRNHIKLKIGNDGTVDVDSDCSDSEESERESDTTDGCDTHSACDTEPNSSSRVLRQNAIDSFGAKTISSSCSSWENSFGYVRYFDTSNDLHLDLSQQNVNADCTKKLFDDISPFYNSLQKSSRNNNLNVQHSGSSENFGFEGRNFMACEDLVNIDQNTQIGNSGNEDNDFQLTRRSFPNCNLKTDGKPKQWKSTDESYCRIEIDNEDAVMSDLLKVLDPPSPKYDKDYPDEPIILDPPPMFRNVEDDLKVINVSLNDDIPFRKHSLNSDKKLRRSISKSMVEADKKIINAHIERMSSQSDNQRDRKKCECCNRSLCPSPRSSDSGVAGSCNLASPELNVPEYVTAGNNVNEADSHDNIDMTGSLHNLINHALINRKQTLSDIVAATFEEQCRCTSPFGSTARTSCVTSVTSEVSLDVKDLSNTDVRPTFVASPPVSSPKIKRTSVRYNIERYVPELKLKPEVPPRIYRKPSTHLELPKNVRHPVPCQWSTLNITERSKPSLHYHMRIYRENPENTENRLSRKDLSRNCDTQLNKQNNNAFKSPNSRSRSEDLLKGKNKSEADTGFMVYRSDLYAHWWMKAKLPITVVTDSGKDHLFVK